MNFDIEDTIEPTTDAEAILKDGTDTPIAGKKRVATKNGDPPKQQVEVYEHGFKKPLELHPQHAKADKISFRKGLVEYKITPADALRLAQTGSIKPGISLGSIPWSAAVGLFVNNLDGGRNKAMNDILEKSKEATILNNLT